MRIAVCDDQKESLEKLGEILTKMKRVEYIKKYCQIPPLLMDLEGSESFDVIVMDICWDTDRNGIDFASQIYELYPEIKIIYVTGYHENYCQEIFLSPSNLAGYVKKPVVPGILEANLEKIWRIRKEEERKKLTVIYKNKPLVLLHKDIRYIESRMHKALIHTKKGEFSCYEKLGNLQKRLEKNFLCCHKSYLVNMDEISRIEKYQLVLFDGTELPVSKNRYDEVRKCFFRYIGEGLYSYEMGNH